MIPLMKTAFFREKETLNSLAEWLKTIPKLSMGEKVKEFEKKFAKYQGKKYAILVNSGASANFLLFQALKNLGKLRVNDNIGFSSLTWSTNVAPIIQHGFTPIPLDCSKNTLNVMSDNLEKAIKKYNLKCFFATNVLGFAGDLDNIKKICENNNVLFIEDNCEALGTELGGIKTGNFGLASTFSFFVAHHMSTIEGGMICTDDEELATMLIMIRANGWDRNLPENIQLSLRKKYNVESEFQSKYVFYDLGMNVRPTEITGFLGLMQLEYVSETFKRRENIYNELNGVISDNPELLPISTNHLSFVSNFSFPIVCKTRELREKYYNIFRDKVEIRPIICGNIVHQPFWNKYISHKYELPETNFIHENAFYFGNYPELNNSDLQLIRGLLEI